MASIASRVRDFVQNVGSGELFTTGQLLNLGSRNAIDIALFRLVKNGFLLRLAAGVFAKSQSSFETFSIQDIVREKAARFNKSIFIPPMNLSNPKTVFFTDGCSSRFRSIHGILQLRHQSPSKRNLLGKQTSSSDSRMHTSRAPSEVSDEPLPDLSNLGLSVEDLSELNLDHWMERDTFSKSSSPAKLLLLLFLNLLSSRRNPFSSGRSRRIRHAEHFL